MALRRLLGCLPVAALAMCAWTACKDKADVAKTPPSAADLDGLCDRLGKLCGDSDKHAEANQRDTGDGRQPGLLSSD